MEQKKRKKKVVRAKRGGRNKGLLGAPKRARSKRIVRRKKRARRVQETPYDVAPLRQDIRAYSGGQSGDTQGLSDIERADSESVAELAEEGQDFEAEVISGVENAPDADQGEIRTHEVPEDDVPLEYRNPEQ